MLELKKTTANDPDFISLVAHLDAELTVTDGDEHEFYDQFNKLDKIKYAIVLSENNVALGCGAIKEYDEGTMEVKRMFVLEEQRGRGLATKILRELEDWARELKYKRCLLETGIRQPEAIGLYKKNKYKVIDNYGQYIGVQNSVCFEKFL